MGKVLSVLNRQVNRFNVENRAHRVLSKDKPIPAPRHPSTQKQIDKILDETKEIRDELLSKHKQLDENLRKVYVVSNTTNEAIGKPSDIARLPKNRSSLLDSELGYQEPESIPAGKITLKQAMTILVQHEEDAKKHNVSYISSQYKLNGEDAANLLMYFKSFKIHIPKKPIAGATSGKAKIFLRPSKVQEKPEEVKQIDVKNK